MGSSDPVTLHRDLVSDLPAVGSAVSGFRRSAQVALSFSNPHLLMYTGGKCAFPYGGHSSCL